MINQDNAGFQHETFLASVGINVHRILVVEDFRENTWFFKRAEMG